MGNDVKDFFDKMTPEAFAPENTKPKRNNDSEPVMETPLETGTMSDEEQQRIAKSQDFRSNVLSSLHLLSPNSYARGVLSGNRSKTKLTV